MEQDLIPSWRLLDTSTKTPIPSHFIHKKKKKLKPFYTDQGIFQ